MAKVGTSFVTKQPRNVDIHNSFALMGNEVLLQEYLFEDGCCGCYTVYRTTLTDTRLLLRSEETGCCSCNEGNHMDISIFLRDVSEVLEKTQTLHCCSSLCQSCCYCCNPASTIEVRGTFGSHTVHVAREDRKNLQIEVPAAVANHKLFVHH